MSLDPLSYDSLKCVLQYMEVNKRLLVFNKCSTIRTAEKAVPLRINDSLSFSREMIFLNNAVYQIGVYQHYYTGKVPPAIERSNEEGGVRYEVDRFGLKDRRDKRVLMPGDVEMEKKQFKEDITDDEAIRELEESIRIEESDSDSDSDSDAEKILEEDRAKLAAYQYRRYNLDPPYEQFIQVTVKSGGSRYIERYRHKKTFSEAMKQLTTFLFGGRNQPIFVNRFFICTKILRLPVGVQFRIAELSFMQPVVTGLEVLKPIIHESSFPLKNLQAGFTVAELAIPIVREALTLTINNSFKPDTTLSQLMNATNRKVVLPPLSRPISSEDVLTLAEDWLRAGRPVGTHFQFNVGQVDKAKEKVRIIRNRFNRSSTDENNIIIPMAAKRQLKVFYDEETTRTDSWNMHMIVEAIKQK